MQIEIFQFKELDSTSAHAKRMLDEGQRVPFCVITKTQSAGKGRNQNQWASPEGNLYLSIVLSSEQCGEKPSLLPLRCAWVLHEWLSKVHGLNASVKWPNDLYLHGKKLAGILCEGRGAKPGESHFILGIGVNLNEVPDALHDKATALSNFTDNALDVTEVSQKFVRYFSETWSKFHFSKFKSLMGASEGSLWRGKSEDYYLQSDIDEDGALILDSLSGGVPQRVLSSHHDFEWCFQDGVDATFFIADLGHSAIKVSAYRDGNDRSEVFHAPYEDSALRLLNSELTRQLGESRVPSRCPIYCGVVNRMGLEQFNRSIAEGFVPRPIPKRTIRLRTYYNLEQVGIDRIAAMEAALDWKVGCDVRTSKAICVVSFGTATVIDFITGDGKHCGGYIFPGAKLSYQSILRSFQFQNLANDVDVYPDLGPGNATREAVNRGLLMQQVGGVEQAIRIFAKDQELKIEDITVLVTGGAGRELSDGFAHWIYKERLVIDGLYRILIG